MAKEFRYSPANPIRFVPQVTHDPRYNTLPFDQLPGKCYKQAWKTVDYTRLQVLSDWLPELKVYNAITGRYYSTIAPIIKPDNIQSTAYTFTLYEYQIDFSTFAPGQYYLTLQYTDDDAITHTLISAYQNVQVSQPNTLLYEYKNSENILSVIFDTGITFQIRVEGGIDKYTPKFDAVIYSDQERDQTKLNSVPYESFILTIGDAPGVPDWLQRIINFAFTCDFILIDGVPYQNTEGSKWNVTRPDPQSKSKRETLAVYDIEIMMTDNAFLERLKTGNVDMNGYTPFEVVYPKIGIGTNFSVPAFFFKYWRLDSVSIIKRGINFTLKIGITPGGNEIYQGDFTTSKTAAFRYLFENATTVYLSGLAGTDNDIFLECKNLNAKPVNSANIQPTTGGLVPCMVTEYEEVNAGDFVRDFDIVTGLGKPTGKWPTAVLCDGRNGTTPMGGKFKVGWLDGDATFGTQGAAVGRNAINITNVNQLPAHSFTFQRPRADIVGTQYQGNFAKGGGDRGLYTGDNAQTNTLGSSADIPFLPGSIVSIWVKILS